MELRVFQFFLNNIELPVCIPVDYMHSVLEGIMKQLLKRWFDSKHHSRVYSLRKCSYDIDKCINLVRPPNEIRRTPRSVDTLSFFKANEYRAWLLFYSLPILSGFLPAEYLTCNIVLSDKILKSDLSDAHYNIMLNCF